MEVGRGHAFLPEGLSMGAVHSPPSLAFPSAYTQARPGGSRWSRIRLLFCEEEKGYGEREGGPGEPHPLDGPQAVLGPTGTCSVVPGSRPAGGVSLLCAEVGRRGGLGEGGCLIVHLC